MKNFLHEHQEASAAIQSWPAAKPDKLTGK
jgi:hypothetical protein